MTRPVGSFFRDQMGQLLCVRVIKHDELCSACYYGGNFHSCPGRDRSITGSCAPWLREDGLRVMFVHEKNWTPKERHMYNEYIKSKQDEV